MAGPSDPYTPRVERHVSYVSEFSTNIRHIEGEQNQAADALSRSVLIVTQLPPPLDYHHLT